MDNHPNRIGRAIMLLCAVYALTSLVAFAEEAEEKVAAKTPAPKEEAVDLTKLPLGRVRELDEKMCRKGMQDIDTRLRALQKERHGLIRKEATLKSPAQRRADLPAEVRKLHSEIQALQQELQKKNRRFDEMMDGLDSVKNLRKEQQKLTAEWKRLVILKDAMLRQTRNLKSDKKGAANADKAG